MDHSKLLKRYDYIGGGAYILTSVYIHMWKEFLASSVFAMAYQNFSSISPMSLSEVAPG